MRLRPLVSALGIALGAACADDASVISAEVVKSDSAGVAIVTLGDSLGAYSPVSATDTLRLRGAPEDLFGGNPQIAFALRDGGTLLSDWQIVAAFDSTGAYAGIPMRQGRGPGEVTTLAGIWQTADDSLWVSDISTRRISRFSSSLRYARSVEYPRFNAASALSVFSVLNGDTTAVVEFSLDDPAGPPGMISREYRVGTWLMDGAATLGESRQFAESQRFADGVLPPRVGGLSTPYTRAAQWVGYGRCMIFGFPDRWELRIEAADSSGQFSNVALLRAPNDAAAAVSAERKEQHIRESVARIPESAAALRAQIERVMRDQLIYPERVPSFGRVMVSDDGAIWVQRFRESAAREPDRWTVVDAQGIRAWRFDLPAGARVLAVRPQAVLVATRDADDVEAQSWLRLPELAGIRLLPSCRVSR